MTARKAFPLRWPLFGGASSWVLAAFVITYALVAALLAVSQEGPSGFLAGALFLLVLLSAGVFIGSLLEIRRAVQRVFLALSIVPGLTLARLVFAGASLSILNPLFVYLLLAAALTTFPASEQRSWELRDPTLGAVLRALPFRAALAAAFIVLGLVLPLQASSPPEGAVWIFLLAIVPSAFLDEFWFRGILQSGLAGVGTRRMGWLITVALFVAYGAPFGNLNTLLFRAAYGTVFGAVAMGRGNLAVTLVARTAMSIALVALGTGLAGGSLLV